MEEPILVLKLKKYTPIVAYFFIIKLLVINLHTNH
ncbi:hypothetical protein [Acinetobacter phage Ab69]|nr:hypothetical protein [Acinetobacter phage Ab69]